MSGNRPFLHFPSLFMQPGITQSNHPSLVHLTIMMGFYFSSFQVPTAGMSLLPSKPSPLGSSLSFPRSPHRDIAGNHTQADLPDKVEPESLETGPKLPLGCTHPQRSGLGLAPGLPLQQASEPFTQRQPWGESPVLTQTVTVAY